MTHPLKGVNQGENFERNLKIYVERLDGSSFKSIHQKNREITYNRCRQIFFKMERRHHSLRNVKDKPARYSIYLWDCFYKLNYLIKRI